MDQWTKRFRNHPIFVTLGELGPAINESLKRPEAAEEGVREGLERLRKVNEFVGKRLDATDGALVIPAPLDQLANHMRDVVSAVNGFAANGQANLIENANGAAEAALSNLVHLTLPLGEAELAGQRIALESYRETMQRAAAESAAAVAALREAVEKANSSLSELRAEVDAQSAANTQLTSDLQGRFTKDQQSREERFVEVRDKYSEELARVDATTKRDLETLTREHKESLGKIEVDHTTQARAILEQIDAKREEVTKLVGVIGSQGVAYGYQKTAEDAAKAVAIWQRATVGSLVALVLFVLCFFVLHIGAPDSGTTQVSPTAELFEIASRLALTIALGVLAGYAGSQASRYQEVERTNRRLALELAAIGPYIESLPEAEKEKFRVLIGKRSFGRSTPAIGGDAPTNAIALLKNKKTRELIIEVLRAIRGVDGSK